MFIIDYHLKDKPDKAYEKILEELDIPIAEIKNKIMGCVRSLVVKLLKHSSLLQTVSTCFGHSVKHRNVLP